LTSFLNRSLLVFALVWWPMRAHAAPGDATRLEYARSEQAASCPDQTALRTLVVKHLGYDPFFPVARQTIVVEITGVAEGLRAQMHLVNDQGMIVGSRELRERPEHCDELVASLALAISIALDPSAAPNTSDDSVAPPPKQAEQAQPEGAPSAEAKAEPVAPEVPAPTAKVPPPKRKPKSPPRAPAAATGQIPIALRVGGFAALGAAPALAFGFRVGASASWGWVRLLTEFADQLPASKTVDHVGGARASQLSATFAPCAAQQTVAACALLNIGSLHVQGTEILDAASEHLLNVTLGVRFEYSPTLFGRLRLLTSLDIDKSLTPITLRVHDQVIWKTPVVWPVLGLGLSWQF
jgi:hypothetical protein